jgi:hypothetical protein
MFVVHWLVILRDVYPSLFILYRRYTVFISAYLKSERGIMVALTMFEVYEWRQIISEEE